MKKFWKKVLASSLAFICTVTAGVAAIVTGGFGLFNAAQVEGFDYNKQLSFGNFFGNGIMLTASAAEANTGTSVFESVVSDAGTVSSLTTVNMASTPFAYRDLTLYENQTVVKIGIPVKTVTDYTADSLFTVYVVSYDEPLTTFTQVSEHKLTIPANTFTSNTVNEWYYFDTNITVGENQTLGFTSSSDTICWGFLSSSKTQYALYNKLFSGYGTSAYGLFDVYTSDSTTPSTPENGTVRLTATITPASASIQTVDWKVTWKNASSTWASGKTVTDYVNITPTEDGALTADIECQQAFGEQVTVTVTSRDDPTLTANCTVDYAKRIEKVHFTLQPNGLEPHSSAEDTLTLTFGFSDAFMLYSYGTSYEYSIGTVEDTYELTAKFYVDYDEEIFADIEAATGHVYTVQESFSNGQFLGDPQYIRVFFKVDGSILTSIKLEEIELLEKYFYDHPEAVTKVFRMEIKVTGAYSTFEKDFKIAFDKNALYTPAEGVGLDKSAIVL